MIKVAVVGAGFMARQHILAFADLPSVAVVGIYCRTQARGEALAAEFDVPQVCTSVSELHAKTYADILVIAVPELAARQVSLACFPFPWTVLMEKPPGYNLADAEQVEAAALKHQRQVFVGLNRRFLASTQTALIDLETQPGHRIIHVQDQQCLETAREVGHPAKVVENWMYANSIHLVDYLTLFGRGRVARVTPVWPWKPDGALTLAAIDFESGDRGIYEGIWKGPGPWAVTVTTDQKRWELRPLEQARFQSVHERRLTEAPGHDWDKAFKPGLRLQAEEVVKSVRGEPSQAVTLQQAMETMRLIHALYT